jgi:hypothetical protein
MPDRGALSRYLQFARYLGRTHALGEQPGGAQPTLLQGAAISAPAPARTPAGTCSRTWVHARPILP